MTTGLDIKKENNRHLGKKEKLGVRLREKQMASNRKITQKEKCKARPVLRVWRQRIGPRLAGCLRKGSGFRKGRGRADNDDNDDNDDKEDNDDDDDNDANDQRP